MRPTLRPGDGLFAWRGGVPRPGQLRIFPDPTKRTRWLVKRVGAVYRSAGELTFEACSDNPTAAGVVDSRQLGPIAGAGSYRVIWTIRGPQKAP